MNNLLKCLILLLFIFSAQSCARTIQYYQKPNIGSPIDSNFAQIYLIRPNFLGFLMKNTVYQNQDLIGRLGPLNYLHWQTKPCSVEILSTQWYYKSKINLEATAGHTYYLKQGVINGSFFHGPKIILLNNSKGQNYINKLKIDIN